MDQSKVKLGPVPLKARYECLEGLVVAVEHIRSTQGNWEVNELGRHPALVENGIGEVGHGLQRRRLHDMPMLHVTCICQLHGHFSEAWSNVLTIAEMKAQLDVIMDLVGHAGDIINHVLAVIPPRR